ncbi:hypothetical protein CPB85DRAFT_1440734 [Mucidula mucida]|nr:hypothetical protein CPB85DRAFT_1440734 [Mucidula mucida]
MSVLVGRMTTPVWSASESIPSHNAGQTPHASSAIHGSHDDARMCPISYGFATKPILHLGHAWVYECTKILHRDISISNIMYRVKEDGRICGVLNDFDLSSCLSSSKTMYPPPRFSALEPSLHGN